MADLLKNSDELRNYYQTNRNYFSEGFVTFLDGLLEGKAE